MVREPTLRLILSLGTGLSGPRDGNALDKVLTYVFSVGGITWCGGLESERRKQVKLFDIGFYRKSKLL